MDGTRIQKHWASEVDALLSTYKQFETLIPSAKGKGAAHRGEDGRFIEDLLREYLRRYLPQGLEIFPGFILRLAVKTGKSGKERRVEADRNSTQLDLIIYDSMNYPVFKRLGNSAIVPPEGVVGIISVKKHLNDGDIKRECKSLFDAAALCSTITSNDSIDKRRGPFLAVASVTSEIKKKKTEPLDWIFRNMQEVYAVQSDVTFERLIGYIGALNEWSIFKSNPSKEPTTSAKFVGFKHKEKELHHLGLQFIVTGILDVFYDESCRNLRRPGYTAFPPLASIAHGLGSIDCDRLR